MRDHAILVHQRVDYAGCAHVGSGSAHANRCHHHQGIGIGFQDNASALACAIGIAVEGIAAGIVLHGTGRMRDHLRQIADDGFSAALGNNGGNRCAHAGGTAGNRNIGSNVDEIGVQIGIYHDGIAGFNIGLFAHLCTHGRFCNHHGDIAGYARAGGAHRTSRRNHIGTILAFRNDDNILARLQRIGNQLRLCADEGGHFVFKYAHIHRCAGGDA